MVELLHVVIIVLLRLRVIKAFLLIQKPSTDIMLCIPIWLYTRSRVQFWNYRSPPSSFSQLSNFIFLNLILYGAQLLNTQDRQLTPNQTPLRTQGDYQIAMVRTLAHGFALRDYNSLCLAPTARSGEAEGKKKARLIISDLVWKIYIWNRKIFS